ncbi:MAG: hypothetical protein ACI8RY_001357 [Urechidicola sp.]|jgi:hypothetical protein|tara:strand:+ start:813 stop:2222 length:1410 start_codon:yes stop_codon:yes gene_type:complete
MKKIYTLIAILALSISMFAQAPEKMSYQAVVRDASGVLITSSSVGVRLSVVQGTPTGTTVYSETHSATSNVNGLISVEIGGGTTVSGTFSTITWATNTYYIKTEIDPVGGTTYTISGTSQLISVPYALYSKISGSSTPGPAGPTGSPGPTGPTGASGGGDTTWLKTGNNIYNNNFGYNVGIGTNAPLSMLSISDTNADMRIGYPNSYNNANSGVLSFEERISDPLGCGLLFQHNGFENRLFIMGRCPTNDTIASFPRSSSSGTNINGRLRVGDLSLATNPLSVSGNSDFSGNVTITGNLNVTGSISKGSGTFKIDHPLDPANKYLIHSFVESPEMTNVYSGNISTNANGYATVTLPDYFEAANKDFRYQLTVIGFFTQVIVKEKIRNNSFVIQTKTPNVEVSWQVTGVRADNYANENRIEPVVIKETPGTYLHPKVHGQSADKSEEAVRVKKELERIKAIEAASNDADK